MLEDFYSISAEETGAVNERTMEKPGVEDKSRSVRREGKHESVDGSANVL